MLRSEGDLDTESAIRLLGRKDSIQKIGIPTLQDARLSCGKRMAYAAVGGGLNAKSMTRFSGRKGSGC